MTERFRLSVNGVPAEVEADSDTPLLYALRNDLGLKGTRFGCGSGQCGACFVLIDGHAGFCDFARDATPLREIGRRRGRLHSHHIVADRLIEMFAIGVDIEETVALEHGFFELGDFRQRRIDRGGIA